MYEVISVTMNASIIVEIYMMELFSSSGWGIHLAIRHNGDVAIAGGNFCICQSTEIGSEGRMYKNFKRLYCIA